MTMPDDHGRDPESDALLDRCLQADMGWIGLIKEIRSRHGSSLFEAQELALSHEGWRRWVARRLNVDPSCRKQAWRHIRDHGAASFFVQRGDRIEFRSAGEARHHEAPSG